jgi:dihydroorotase
MKNITNVPFPFGSGREKDQISAFQKEDAIISIFFNNLEERFWKLKFFFGHLITSSV